jgi:hypothetical protein
MLNKRLRDSIYGNNAIVSFMKRLRIVHDLTVLLYVLPVPTYNSLRASANAKFTSNAMQVSLAIRVGNVHEKFQTANTKTVILGLIEAKIGCFPLLFAVSWSVNSQILE